MKQERIFIHNASLLKRILAFVVDILILDVVVFFPFTNIMKKIIPSSYDLKSVYNYINLNPDVMSKLTYLSIFIAILAILYFSLLEYKLQQSIGKKLLKLYVKSLRQNKNPSFLQCLLRNIYLFPVFPFFALWIIDPLFAFFTKNNQRLSEVLSSTMVVEHYRI